MCHGMNTALCRCVYLVEKTNTNLTTSQISADHATTTRTHVSARTVYRRLNKLGLYARNLVQCIPHKTGHSQERLRCFKEHIVRVSNSG